MKWKSFYQTVFIVFIVKKQRGKVELCEQCVIICIIDFLLQL